MAVGSSLPGKSSVLAPFFAVREQHVTAVGCVFSAARLVYFLFKLYTTSLTRDAVPCMYVALCHAHAWMVAIVLLLRFRDPASPEESERRIAAAADGYRRSSSSMQVGCCNALVFCACLRTIRYYRAVKHSITQVGCSSRALAAFLCVQVGSGTALVAVPLMQVVVVASLLLLCIRVSSITKPSIDRAHHADQLSHCIFCGTPGCHVRVSSV